MEKGCSAFLCIVGRIVHNLNGSGIILVHSFETEGKDRKRPNGQ